MAEELGLRRVIPDGKRQNEMDAEFDHTGWFFEIKAVTTSSTEYKVRMKKEEADRKKAYVRKHKGRGGVMVVVLDEDKGEAHAYWRKGIRNYRLTKGNYREWNYAGRVPYRGRGKR